MEKLYSIFDICMDGVCIKNRVLSLDCLDVGNSILHDLKSISNLSSKTALYLEKQEIDHLFKAYFENKNYKTYFTPKST